jgi:hypothetical protein
MIQDQQPIFRYSEAQTARALGCSRGELRYLRANVLQEGVHWQKNHGGEILLSDLGLDRVLELEGLKSEVDREALAEKKPGSNNVHWMTICRIPFNPRMVEATFEDDPVPHLVDVGRNKTFAIGDVIEVGPHEVAKDIYQLLSAIPRDRRRPFHA